MYKTRHPVFIDPAYSLHVLHRLFFVSYPGVLNGQGVPFFVSVALGVSHLVRLFAKIDFENKESCDAYLINNTWFGFWVWAGAMADYAVKMQL